ncbi:MAG TPA: histidine kinase N-terminal 7TM domain-containing protein [Anaerolineales bacterium]|nr:histidine kinase N-terminal 7TM domain-containing protein [Anaerolineales bacterium]
MTLFLSVLLVFSDVLTAGIAITAFSLLVYALTFNLRDRVARSFAFIMACVVVVFAGEALSGVTHDMEMAKLWLRLQWVGLVFIPATYLHFSDALLETTGKPSRGRRRMLYRLTYLIALGFLLLLLTPWLVGDVVEGTRGALRFERTPLTWVFVIFYTGGLTFAWINLWRAYRRTVTATGLRRMRYLLTGAIAPPLGSFPYLMFGAGFAGSFPVVFWLATILNNIVVFIFLVAMAYAVAFFGVSWPDRVVKRRLAKWLMRGPVTAFIVLGVTTFVQRTGQFLGVPETVLVPMAMALTILLMEHWISLAAPLWERWLFNPGDQEDLRLLQTLEERVLTTSDLRQFLEGILAAVCDRFQVQTAFIAATGETGVEVLLTMGGDLPEDLSQNILELSTTDTGDHDLFSWGDYLLIPLRPMNDDQILGLIGVRTVQTPGDDLPEGVRLLAERAALALEDRRSQQQVFTSLKSLSPQVEYLQRLRAASRYDSAGALAPSEDLPESVDLPQSVKDALSHYWGGPKLSQSPLMRLRVVQRALEEHEGNPSNALRAILKEAIERVRPEGERRFTAEWILYNILELKFMQGRKVREVALRLAMSEADLYRKQRVAIEAVAQAIEEMERQVFEEENGTSPVSITQSLPDFHPTRLPE